MTNCSISLVAGTLVSLPRTQLNFFFATEPPLASFRTEEVWSKD